MERCSLSFTLRLVRTLSSLSSPYPPELSTHTEALADKDAQHDNDLRNRSDWTNWCGPNDPDYFTPTNCAELLSALSRCATVPSPSSFTFLDDEDAGPPAHVFQILDRAGRAIATFPKSADHSRGEKGKSYDVEEFAALAREVLQRPREAVASKTSCTRRYRSKHPVYVHFLSSPIVTFPS